MNQRVVEGGTVFLYGYELIVRDLRVYTACETGEPYIRFRGVCTDNPVNDEIRGTVYDGGIYGGNRFVYDW